jgi:hypothetical protein
MTSIKLIDENTGDFVTLDIDEETNALVTMGEPHALLHQGKMFTVSMFDEAVADNGYLTLQIATGADEVHIGGVVDAGGDAVVSLTEGASTTGGTPLNVYNKNRNSAGVSLSTVTVNPTISVSGTVLYEEFIIGGVYNQAIGANTRTNGEWELAPNTKYLFRAQNRAGLAKVISVSLEFYEL